MHFFDPITDFIFIENEPEPADVIFIPGGPCGEIALHASAATAFSILSIAEPGRRKNTAAGNFPPRLIFSPPFLWKRASRPKTSCRSVRPPSPTKTLSIQGSSPTPSVSRFGPLFSPARPITPAGPSFITRPFSRRPGSWLHPLSPRESGVRTGLDGRKPSIWSFRRWSTAAASSTKS